MSIYLTSVLASDNKPSGVEEAEILVNEAVTNTMHFASEVVNQGAQNHHSDPVVPVLLALVVIFIAAKLGAIVASYLKQPLVLGELVGGIAIGNLALIKIPYFEFIKNDENIAIFAGLGVIILLFEVGLETNIKEMLAVGARSTLVAIVGVVTPFILGYYAISMIVPGLSDMTKLFMGAIMTATSVGITARVFQELNRLRTDEARIVLGAAVIDDILGLIILAIVSGLAVYGNIGADEVMSISVKAIGFVVLSLFAGVLLAQRTFKLIAFFKLPGMMLIAALLFCFIGAYFADQAGLATIVGAFAAGLILEDLHFKNFDSEKHIEDYIQPISLFFVPIFFVLTGMKVNLAVFADFKILGAALALTAMAIIGKVVSGWSFMSKTKINRMLIGAGMIPRGEVGLIFAIVGREIGVIDDALYAITVIMVVITTFITPPLLDYLIKSESK